MQKFCIQRYDETTGCLNNCPCTGDSITCEKETVTGQTCPAETYCVGNR